MKKIIPFATALTAPLAGMATASADRPPNVVIVLFDDAGYSDFGFMGAEIQTPVMDRLAHRGVLLPQFYNNAQCVPTRGALLTGMSAHGSGYGGMRSHPHPNRLTGEDAYVPIRAGTIAVSEVLKANGYHTFLTGKWHLGGAPGLAPNDRGFDKFFGIISGAGQFFKDKLTPERVKNEGWRRDDKRLVLDDFPDGFYATDAFVDEAIGWIRATPPEDPFFLFLSFTAPHWPLQAPEELVAKYLPLYEHAGWQEFQRKRFEKQKELGLLPAHAKLPAAWPRGLDETPEVKARMAVAMATYAAMMDAADQALGRLVAELENRGVFENTLFILLSDNGADNVHGDGWVQVNNAPFRLMKTFVHEGGARTPLVAVWPKRIPAGKVNLRQYGHVSDLLPTILAATGAKLPEKNPRGEALKPFEGQNLLPAFENPDFASNRPLCIERMGNEMIRDGDWKLVRRYNFAFDDKAAKTLFHTKGPRVGAWELYNLSEDPTETTDLASRHPEKVAGLIAKFGAWGESVGLVDRETQAAQEEGAAKADQ